MENIKQWCMTFIGCIALCINVCGMQQQEPLLTDHQQTQLVTALTGIKRALYEKNSEAVNAQIRGALQFLPNEGYIRRELQKIQACAVVNNFDRAMVIFITFIGSLTRHQNPQLRSVAQRVQESDEEGNIFQDAQDTAPARTENDLHIPLQRAPQIQAPTYFRRFIHFSNNHRYTLGVITCCLVIGYAWYRSRAKQRQKNNQFLYKPNTNK